jgi:hypothetical protein
MVVFSEVSPCRLDRNAPDLGGGGWWSYNRGRHVPAESHTFHPHKPQNIKPWFYKLTRDLLLRLREGKEKKYGEFLAVPKSLPANGSAHNFYV